MSDHDHESGDFFRWLVVGFLVGAGVIYFLTSTKEGEVVKKKIRKKSEEALDSLADLVEEFEEKGEEFQIRAKKLTTELEKKAKDFQKEVAEDAQEKLSHIDRLRQKGRLVTQKFFTRNGKTLTS